MGTVTAAVSGCRFNGSGLNMLTSAVDKFVAPVAVAGAARTFPAESSEDNKVPVAKYPSRGTGVEAIVNGEANTSVPRGNLSQSAIYIL